MKSVFAILLPEKADNRIRGSKIPLYFFILVAAIGIVRSLIHMLAPDGGAGSIAGMNMAVAGAGEVIFVFAQWGGTQLVYALLQWVVVLRYRSLVPFMWIVQLLETLLCIFNGHNKPTTFTHTPPGAFQNYVYLALAVVMLCVSLWSAHKSVDE